MSGSQQARVLAVEPWLGGSHARFLEQWRARSRHAVEVIGLAARHWKWRMRGGAWELARRVAQASPADVLLASDYLDLASFRGFLPASWARVPTLVYFHENQLTYPQRPDEAPAERDRHFGFTNVLTCVAADRVVFNSAFHRDAFAAAARELLASLPRPNPRTELERALERALVIAPGIDLDGVALGPGAPTGAPLRVVFNHRFEHDKDPRAFLDAVRSALAHGARLELVVLGERFERLPDGVEALLVELAPAVVHQGFVADAAEYARLLGTADLVVSTARHEFFGMAVTEAMAAGCTPLLPRRLSYPELLPAELHAKCLYDDERALAERLLAHAAAPAALRSATTRAAQRAAVARFSADEVARQLDAACAESSAAT